jgi:leucyl aminopeptidase (aminopeptidase T)
VGAYYIAVYGNNNAYNTTDCYTLKASLANTAWADENQTTGITDMKAEIQYNVYPNPNNGKFHLMISTSELLSKVTVKVMDMIGNTIHLDEYENMEGLYTYEINLQGVAPEYTTWSSLMGKVQKPARSLYRNKVLLLLIV